MEAEFWLERWQKNEIGFHQPTGHDLLRRHWARMGAATGCNVLVPLCGKSRDMMWLAADGFDVTGVELSELAIAQFFEDAGLTPTIVADGSFEISSAERVTLMRGDIFQLQARQAATIGAVYDRAALIALTGDQRIQYAAVLSRLLKPGMPMLLISVDYPDGEINGPPFAVNRGEIEQLFSDAFAIAELETRDGLEQSRNLRDRGVTRLDETAYLLVRRA